MLQIDSSPSSNRASSYLSRIFFNLQNENESELRKYLSKIGTYEEDLYNLKEENRSLALLIIPLLYQKIICYGDDILRLIDALAERHEFKIVMLNNKFLEALLDNIDLENDSLHSVAKSIETIQKLIRDIEIKELSVEIKTFVNWIINAICEQEMIFSITLNILALLSLNKVVKNFIAEKADQKTLYLGIIHLLQTKDQSITTNALLFLSNLSLGHDSADKFFTESNTKRAFCHIFNVLYESNDYSLCHAAFVLFSVLISNERIIKLLEGFESKNLKKLYGNMISNMGKATVNRVALVSQAVVLSINQSTILTIEIESCIRNFRPEVIDSCVLFVVSNFPLINDTTDNEEDCKNLCDMFSFLNLLCRSTDVLSLNPSELVRDIGTTHLQQLNYHSDTTNPSLWIDEKKILTINVISSILLLKHGLCDSYAKSCLDGSLICYYFVWGMNCRYRTHFVCVTAAIACSLQLPSNISEKMLQYNKEETNLQFEIEHFVDKKKENEKEELYKIKRFHSNYPLFCNYSTETIQDLLSNAKEKIRIEKENNRLLQERMAVDEQNKECESEREKNILAINKQHEGLQAEHLRVLSEGTKLKNKIMEAEHISERLRVKYEKKQIEWQEIKKELSAQIQYASQLEENVREYEQVITETSTSNRELNKRLEGSNKKLNELKTENKISQSRVAESEKLLNNSKTMHNELQQKLKENEEFLAAQCKKFDSEILDKSIQIATLSTESSEKSQQVVDLTKELYEKSSQILQIQSENNNKQIEIDRLKNDFSGLKENCSAVDAQLNLEKEKSNQLQIQVNELCVKNQENLSAIKEKEDIITELQQKLKESHLYTEKLEQEINTAKEETTTTKSSMEQKNKEYEKLESIALHQKEILTSIHSLTLSGQDLMNFSLNKTM